jgi:CBS domain-containing protein
MEGRMRVFEIMSGPVRTVSPGTPAREARALLDAHRVRHLVVTSRDQVVGVVSNRDIDAAAPGSAVGDVMTAPVVTLERTETVRKAANLMQGRTIGCLPVTDGGRLVGIVTTSDLLRLVGGGAARPEPRSRRTANHRVPHRKARSATGRW